MESIVITPNDKHDIEMLKRLAMKMGFQVSVLNDEDKVDAGLLRAMMEARKGKLVSPETVMKNLRS